jgi:hypothetical protein
VSKKIALNVGGLLLLTERHHAPQVQTPPTLSSRADMKQIAGGSQEPVRCPESAYGDAGRLNDDEDIPDPQGVRSRYPNTRPATAASTSQ